MADFKTFTHLLKRTGRVIALFALLFVTSLGTLTVQADGPAPKNSSAKFEGKFLTEMIHHHMMAVHMAQMCLDKAVHPELQTLCQNIIADQTAEIEMMQMWLHHWYGITHDPDHDMHMSGQLHHLMEASGAEFEIMFMEMMIKHHQGALKEAEKCLKKAYHPELLSLCQDIIATQSAEIQHMQNWLCQWYDICKPHHSS